MSHPIDEYVKRNLADHKIAPRRDLFAEKIQPQINQRKAAALPFLRVAAAIVLLLAAWMVVKMVSKPTDAGSIMQELPVAVEQPLESPKNVVSPENIETENEALPLQAATAETRKQVAAETRQPKANRPKSIKKAEANALNDKVLQEDAVIAENSEESTSPIEIEKPKVKVKFTIDPTKYTLAATEETAPTTEQPKVLEYAEAQLNNVKSGEKLQAPPKEWFELPKLAVRVDGNPIKGILKGRD